MFLISDRLPWQGFHAHQTCCSRLIQPSHSGSGEPPRHSLMFAGSGLPCRGDIHMEPCHSPVDTNGRVWWSGNISSLFFFFVYLSLQLQHVRADVPVSFSILDRCVTFFMMALYRPHYLPFYYLKVYYLFMHQFNLLFCNELLCGRTWRFKKCYGSGFGFPRRWIDSVTFYLIQSLNFGATEVIFIEASYTFIALVGALTHSLKQLVLLWEGRFYWKPLGHIWCATQ